MAEPANEQKHREWVLAALEKYECRLTRYAVRLIGDLDAARDAVQHSFLRLCDANREEIESHLAAWLYTVCRNKALDMLRSNRRFLSTDFRAPPRSNGVAEPMGRDDDPATAAEESDLSDWINGLLTELPKRHREVVDLLLDGFSYSQIADITGRSVGNTRVIAHRAITRLREHPQVRELLFPASDQPTCTQSTSTLRASS